MNATFGFFYIPCSQEEEAIGIARQLLSEELIACANISSPVRSLYRWEGEIQDASEVILSLKTTLEAREAVRKRVGELHSYDCPCILELAPYGVNKAYLDWLNGEVKSKAPKLPKEIEQTKTISSDDERPPWD